MNDLIKDLYAFELSRKDGLTSRLPFSFTVLTILGSLIAFMAKHLLQLGSPFQYILGLPLAISIVAFSLAVYSLYMCLVGRTYSVLALGSEFLKWKDDVGEHFGAEGRNLAKEYVEASLCRRMVESMDVNSAINDIRAAHLNRAYTYVGVSAVFVVICGLGIALVLI